MHTQSVPADSSLYVSFLAVYYLPSLVSLFFTFYLDFLNLLCIICIYRYVVLKTTCSNIHIKLLRTILSGKAGMIMNTSTAYYSSAESISNKKFANNQARRHTLYIKDQQVQ